MSFRLRLTLLSSLAVAVAIIGTSVVVYYTDRHELFGQVDGDLRSTLDLAPLRALAAGGLSRPGGFTAGALGYSAPRAARLLEIPPAAFKQFAVVLPRSSTDVEVRALARKAGATPSNAPARFTTVMVKGVPTRTLTLITPTETITLSRSLLEDDRDLSHLLWLLVFVSLGGVGAATILGALVSGRAVAPLRRLTEATERIVETGDLSERTGRRGRDEISRLSTRLDELLASLEVSLRTQRQLVADASHELRTPLTTLRANVGLLVRPGAALAESERVGLLADIEEELVAMTTLVGELVELARGEEADVAPHAFRLDEVVQALVERTARRTTTVSFTTRLQPSLVSGVPERVERAVSNLLDNAQKWSPASETVDVAVHDGVVEVRDRGPGIDAEDRPLVFNRFYRSKRARGMPGAGLGLAIVKQIAEAHGGSVTVEDAPGGGAILRLRLVRTP